MNHMVHYASQENKGYLRICRPHEEPRKYVDRIISDYCEQAGIEEHEKELREIIAEKIRSEKNLRKFFHIGMAWGKEYPESVSPYAEFMLTKNASLIGLAGDMPEWFKPMLPKFVRFASAPLYDYLLNSHLKNCQYHTYFTGKWKAYEIIAGLAGASRIIPASRYMCLHYSGKTRVGLSVEPAEGITTYLLKAGEVKISPSISVIPERYYHSEYA